MLVSQGWLISRAAARMSVRVGEEFNPISEEASDKKNLRRKRITQTNVFQEEWFVDKNSEITKNDLILNSTPENRL